VICSQIDGCGDKEIQARFGEQYVPKAYHVYKEEKEKVVPTDTILYF
jgi:hypothetical protein